VSRYRITLDPVATTTRAAMDTGLRTRFDNALDGLGDDPYGCGSTPIRSQEPDRREVTLAGCFVVYYVSSAVLIVTLVRIQGPP